MAAAAVPNKRMEDQEPTVEAVVIMAPVLILVAQELPVVLAEEIMESPDLQVLAAAAAVALRVLELLVQQEMVAQVLRLQ